MQLFEALQWWGQTPGFEVLNTIGSLLAALLLYTHPLAVVTGLSIDKEYKAQASTPLFKTATIAAVVVLLYGIYRVGSAYLNNTNAFLSLPDKLSGHLIWDFPSNYIVIVLLILGISAAFVLPVNKAVFVASAAYFLLPVALIIIFMKLASKNLNKSYLGSYWCWYVAAFSFLIYFGNGLLSKGRPSKLTGN